MIIATVMAARVLRRIMVMLIAIDIKNSFEFSPESDLRNACSSLQRQIYSGID